MGPMGILPTLPQQLSYESQSKAHRCLLKLGLEQSLRPSTKPKPNKVRTLLDPELQTAPAHSRYSGLLPFGSLWPS